jgi:hypothetical protein
MAHATTFRATSTVGSELGSGLDALAVALETLDGVERSALTPSEVAAGLLRLQRLLDHGAVVLAGYVSAADAAAVWAGSGSKNITGWLADRTQSGYAKAVEVTKLADVLDANETLSRRVRDGDVSTATATALAPTLLAPPEGVGTVEIDALVESCRGADPKHARAAAESWKDAHHTVDQAELARRRFARRSLRFAHPVDGMVALAGLLPTFEADQLRKTLIAHGGGRPQPGDTRTSEQRAADGLLVLARSASTGPGLQTPHSVDDDDSLGYQPAGGRQSSTLLVTIALDTLAGSNDLPARTEFDQPIPAVVARAVAQQATRDDLVPVVHDGTVVLGVGATTNLALGRRVRLATNAQYLALVVRDGHCRWHRCNAPASWCQVDHLHAWEAGGLTDLDNLWLLCSKHHTEKHRSGTGTRAGPHGTNGRVVVQLPNDERFVSEPDGLIARLSRVSSTG